ncbi:MAG: MerR family transcriptional regulator [Candidatus Sumerlaeaceae bacterium]|nr:MerR family transcriptional regulator [Candidatus Sumerlaeaceae bacterium]
MSQSDMPKIPDKLFYRINDVAEITGVPPYVLRYWESEFPMLRPERDEKGERRYRKSDIELIFQIKKLVYEQRFTLAGARQQLKAMRKTGAAARTGESAEPAELPPATGRPLDPQFANELSQAISQMREELTALYRLLSSP